MWLCDRFSSFSMDDNSQCVFALESLLRLETPESSVSLICFIWSLYKNKQKCHKCIIRHKKMHWKRFKYHIANFLRIESNLWCVLFVSSAIAISISHNIAVIDASAHLATAITAGRSIANAWMACVVRWCRVLEKINEIIFDYNQKSICFNRYKWASVRTLSLVVVMVSETLMSSDEKNGNTPDKWLQFFSSVLESKNIGDSTIQWKKKTKFNPM